VARLSARERAGLPDRAFAYVDSDGVRRLPIHDAAHVRSALSRFGQVRFESDEARDRARQRLLTAAKRHGIMPMGFLTRQLRSTGRPVLPTGNVTFLLVDMEGSTRLLQQLDSAYGAVLTDVRRIIAAAVRANGGVRVDAYGDEFFAVFERPRAALDAAVALQRAMSAFPWPAGSVVRVRSGIHGGRPSLTDTGYVGLAVHTVARIASVAHGGQIVVSGQTRTALGEASLDPLRLVSLGTYRLAGLNSDDELFQLYADGLATDFPPLRLLR
jgi:class 3 adenylate cyclase